MLFRSASIFLDPSLHAAATGEINVVRRGDARVGGKDLATLAIESGKIEINSREATRHVIGKFVPGGTLRYSLSDQFVSTAELAGDITYEEVSTDHLLFETRFRTQPKLRVQYHCEKR